MGGVKLVDCRLGTVDSGQWMWIRTGPRGPWISLAAPLTQIQSAPSAEVDTGRDGDRLGEVSGPSICCCLLWFVNVSEGVMLKRQ